MSWLLDLNTLLGHSLIVESPKYNSHEVVIAKNRPVHEVCQSPDDPLTLITTDTPRAQSAPLSTPSNSKLSLFSRRNKSLLINNHKDSACNQRKALKCGYATPEGYIEKYKKSDILRLKSTDHVQSFTNEPDNLSYMTGLFNIIPDIDFLPWKPWLVTKPGTGDKNLNTNFLGHSLNRYISLKYAITFLNILDKPLKTKSILANKDEVQREYKFSSIFFPILKTLNYTQIYHEDTIAFNHLKIFNLFLKTLNIKDLKQLYDELIKRSSDYEVSFLHFTTRFLNSLNPSKITKFQCYFDLFFELQRLDNLVKDYSVLISEGYEHKREMDSILKKYCKTREEFQEEDQLRSTSNYNISQCLDYYTRKYYNTNLQLSTKILCIAIDVHLDRASDEGQQAISAVSNLSLQVDFDESDYFTSCSDGTN